jgi:hypothetical protein
MDFWTIKPSGPAFSLAFVESPKAAEPAYSLGFIIISLFTRPFSWAVMLAFTYTKKGITQWQHNQLSH